MSEDAELVDRRAAARGRKAEEELALLGEAFDRLKAAALDELVATSAGQVDKREKLYLVASISQSVQRALLDIALNGEVARMALAKQDLLRP